MSQNIKEQIRGYLETECLVNFGSNGVTEESHLFEAGVLDSFSMVELVAFLESKFNIRLSPDTLMQSSLWTLNGLTEQVQNEKSGGNFCDLRRSSN